MVGLYIYPILIYVYIRYVFYIYIYILPFQAGCQQGRWGFASTFNNDDTGEYSHEYRIYLHDLELQGCIDPLLLLEIARIYHQNPAYISYARKEKVKMLPWGLNMSEINRTETQEDMTIHGRQALHYYKRAVEVGEGGREKAMGVMAMYENARQYYGDNKAGSLKILLKAESRGIKNEDTLEEMLVEIYRKGLTTHSCKTYTSYQDTQDLAEHCYNELIGMGSPKGYLWKASMTRDGRGSKLRQSISKAENEAKVLAIWIKAEEVGRANFSIYTALANAYAYVDI